MGWGDFVWPNEVKISCIVAEPAASIVAAQELGSNWCNGCCGQAWPRTPWCRHKTDTLWLWQPWGTEWCFQDAPVRPAVSTTLCASMSTLRRGDGPLRGGWAL